MSHKVTLTNYQGSVLTFTADRVVMAPDSLGYLAYDHTDARVLFVNPDTMAVLIEPQPAPPTPEEIAAGAAEAVLRTVTTAVRNATRRAD